MTPEEIEEALWDHIYQGLRQWYIEAYGKEPAGDGDIRLRAVADYELARA